MGDACFNDQIWAYLENNLLKSNDVLRVLNDRATEP